MLPDLRLMLGALYVLIDVIGRLYRMGESSIRLSV
jgi:hypothetical protein